MIFRIQLPLLVLAGCHHSPPAAPAPTRHLPLSPDELRTDGQTALDNLEGQIAALAQAGPSHRATLITLLSLRAQYLGRPDDYGRALALAEEEVRASPKDAAAWLARAQARSSLHQFSAALADADQRGGSGGARGVAARLGVGGDRRRGAGAAGAAKCRASAARHRHAGRAGGTRGAARPARRGGAAVHRRAVRLSRRVAVHRGVALFSGRAAGGARRAFGDGAGTGGTRAAAGLRARRRPPGGRAGNRRRPRRRAGAAGAAGRAARRSRVRGSICCIAAK